jgi:sarcosine oxidase subunit beta
MSPVLRADDITGGVFRQRDGLIDPLAIMRAFTKGAIERGARILFETKINAIEMDARGVAGIETSRGSLATRAVVNAAGAWARDVARLANIDIPVEPLRRQIVRAVPSGGLPADAPMVIDAATGFHFRPDPQADSPEGVLLAYPDPEETVGFKTDFDPAFIAKIQAHARHRAPALAVADVDATRCRAGLYEMTPDHHAIIGEAASAPGFFLANGFSGHGVMHSPATGRIVAEQILYGRARLLDAAPLRLERFAEGRLLEETAFI